MFSGVRPAFTADDSGPAAGWTRGGQIKGHDLSLLKDIPIKTLFLQRTALDDEGLSQAAQIPKLTDIYIAACPQVTFQGLMAVSWRDKLVVHDMDNFDEKGSRGG